MIQRLSTDVTITCRLEWGPHKQRPCTSLRIFRVDPQTTHMLLDSKLPSNFQQNTRYRNTERLATSCFMESEIAQTWIKPLPTGITDVRWETTYLVPWRRSTTLMRISLPCFKRTGGSWPNQLHSCHKYFNLLAYLQNHKWLPSFGAFGQIGDHDHEPIETFHKMFATL